MSLAAFHVKKFGGTSVGSIDRIKSVARRVANEWRSGRPCAVVVSAMSGETDHLINLAYSISSRPEPHEMDVLLATGEQRSVALVTMALHAEGFAAESFYGHRVGMHTDDSHTKAQIRHVEQHRIREALDNQRIPVIAGFQGIAPDGDITTLGRGGSDTTAVAYAAALGVPCEIYTDVKGIYTADPRVVSKARLLEEISHDEIIELSSAGAKVMETRSVILAKRFLVPLVIRPAHEPGEGTWVVEKPRSNSPVVSITADKKTVRFSIVDLPRFVGVQAPLFQELAEKNILVDMIVQNGSDAQRLSFSFTCSEIEKHEVREIAEAYAREYGGTLLDPNENDAKISAIGAGMNDRPGVAATFFRALAEHRINVELINCADLKISVLLNRSHADQSLNVLHDAFELDKLGVQVS